MVSTNQENRREVLGQSVQPGHVQGTGHGSFPGQGHAPVRQRKRAVGVSQIIQQAKGDIMHTESRLNCVMDFFFLSVITFPSSKANIHAVLLTQIK